MKNSLAVYAPAVAALMWCAPVVSADDNTVDAFFAMSPSELAMIPVTIATGTPKPVFQSAGVTSVITAEQIKAMGATQLHEVLDTVPGVHASFQESSYDYKYTIRGISNNTNSQVLILLNGTRIATPFRGTLTTGLELPVEAIARVEVIRGPGSALYGADAFAGVINIITKKAQDLNGTRLGGRVGNWDTESTWLQHGAKLGEWEVAGSFQYQHTAGDNGRIIAADTQTLFDRLFHTQASHAPGPLTTRYESFNGHLNLQRKHWELGFWGFNADDWGTRYGGGGALDPNGAGNTEAYLSDVRYSTEDLFANWQLTAHASYLHSNFQGQFQLFPNNAVLPIGGDGNIKPGGHFNPVFFPDGVNADIGRVEDIPALELGVDYQGFARHLLHMGAGFRYEAFTASERKNFGPGVIDGSQPVVYGDTTEVTGTPFVYLPDSHRTVWSAFLQDEWQFADAWQLTAGVRYDHYSNFGGTVNPRAALVWDINRHLTSKLLYGRAFRAPTFSELGNQNNPVLLGNKELSPETINTFEWAWDYRPTATLTTAVNVYYYEINNLIIPMWDAKQSTSTFQNSGHQNGYGAEFEWNWQLHSQLALAGNYAWQHATNENTDMRVFGVPEHKVYAKLVWHVTPLWQVQPQINWLGGRVSSVSDTRPLTDYETVDLTLSGKKLWGHVNLAASLRNAFDVRGLELAATQLPVNIPVPGRSFYFEASLDF